MSPVSESDIISKIQGAIPVTTRIDLLEYGRIGKTTVKQLAEMLCLFLNNKELNYWLPRFVIE